MAEDIPAVPNLSPTAMESPGAVKRSAAEAFDSDSAEDLKDKETTLDDVLVSPLPKKTRLLDEELPDVDDNEQFPTQEQELDVQLQLEMSGEDAEGQDSDVEALAPPEDSEPTSQHNSLNDEIDIVDVDSSGPGEFQQYSDEDEEETARAVARAQNQREATQLLQQLDDSARSKLCLTALEKYGEELFFGHEDARDAILVDACAQDSILSLMRDAIRVRELYARGSAAAPVELDDDDDETGGYEDEEEEDDDEDKPAASRQNDEDVVVISEEEDEDDETKSDVEPANGVANGAPTENGNNEDDSEEQESEEEEEEEEEEEQPVNGEVASGDDDNDDDEDREDENEAVGDVEATDEVAAADTAT